LKIPVFLANARLSDRSFPRYKRFGWLFRPLFASLAGVGAQNEADAARLREVGCRPEAIHVIGNLKFDAAKLDERRALDVPALLRQIGTPDHAPILVGGSTHDGEELMLAEIARRLRARFPELLLILVPRHFERSGEVGRQLRERGVKFVYRNAIGANTRLAGGEAECLLVNTTGELRFFYERATVVFVGKSMAAIGGQNPIEPAAFGKAMVFGPNMQNFADIARNFIAKNGAVQVNDPEALETAIAGLLSDDNRRAELGRNAQRIVRENLGAVDRTVEMILKELGGGEIYIARQK
jgi:3-deoxy-D-manno-octulosonic-acid transferase